MLLMFIYSHLPSLLPLQIQVTLEKSAHFQLKPCKGCVYSSCLCAGEAKTFQWSVTAEQLGEKHREVGCWNWEGMGPRWGCFARADIEGGAVCSATQSTCLHLSYGHGYSQGCVRRYKNIQDSNQIFLVSR